MHRMKPLYRYAGGKVRVLKTYLPFFRWLRPEHCIDYFGGSGTMSVWFHHLYPDAKLYLNEKDAAIYKLFTCIKDDYAAFCDALEGLEEEIETEETEEQLQREEPWETRKRRYYLLRNWFYNQTQEPSQAWINAYELTQDEIDDMQTNDAYFKWRYGYTESELYAKGVSERDIKNMWSEAMNGFSEDEWEDMSGKNRPREHAMYFYLRILSFSGVNTRNFKGEYTSSAGIHQGDRRFKKPFYDPETLGAFKAMLDHATLFNADYQALELDIQHPKSLHYFDPPYVDASDHLYTSSFGWDKTQELCAYLQRVSEHSTVFMSNFDHPRLKRLMQGFDWYSFPMQGGLYNHRKKETGKARPREILFYKIHPSIAG